MQITQQHLLRQQSGAILAVSLILLLVMTILGVSNMKSAALELRMASNTQSHQHAFQAAETTLKIAENRLHVSGYDDTSVKDCSTGSALCYDDECAGGLCFFGAFSASDVRIDCKSDEMPIILPVWANPVLDVWNTASRHQTADLGSADATASFVVEFLCFVKKGDGTSFDADFFDNGAALYRITALAKSKDMKAQVMLQSTYRLNN